MISKTKGSLECWITKLFQLPFNTPPPHTHTYLPFKPFTFDVCLWSVAALFCFWLQRCWHLKAVVHCQIVQKYRAAKIIDILQSIILIVCIMLCGHCFTLCLCLQSLPLHIRHTCFVLRITTSAYLFFPGGRETSSTLYRSLGNIFSPFLSLTHPLWWGYFIALRVFNLSL